MYIRIGTSTRRANQQSIEDLTREQRRITYDEESSNLSKSILSDELINEFYGKSRSDNEDGDFVKVTFYFEKSTSYEELTNEAILSLVEKKGIIRPRDLSELFHVSRSSVTRRLSKLVAQGKLDRFGNGAGVYYRENNV